MLKVGKNIYLLKNNGNQLFINNIKYTTKTSNSVALF